MTRQSAYQLASSMIVGAGLGLWTYIRFVLGSPRLREGVISSPTGAALVVFVTVSVFSWFGIRLWRKYSLPPANSQDHVVRYIGGLVFGGLFAILFSLETGAHQAALEQPEMPFVEAFLYHSFFTLAISAPIALWGGANMWGGWMARFFGVRK